MESSVKQRLIEYLRYSKIGQNKFEKKAGISNGYIANLKSSPSPEKIKQILDAAPDLNRDWLLYGEGEMLKEETEASEDTPGAAQLRRVRDVEVNIVPLIPVEAFAGPIRSMLAEGIADTECRHVPAPMPGAELAIPVSGDSMEPTIKDGSILYLARINERAFIPWGNVMVLDTENGALVKLVYPSGSDPDAVEARSINPDYPPFDVPKDSIYGIYRVLGLSKFYTTL